MFCAAHISHPTSCKIVMEGSFWLHVHQRFSPLNYAAVTAHLSGLHSAIKMLVERVRMVQEVVTNMRAGKETLCIFGGGCR